MPQREKLAVEAEDDRVVDGERGRVGDAEDRWVAGKGVDADGGAGVRGVDELAVAQVDADVAGQAGNEFAGVEED